MAAPIIASFETSSEGGISPYTIDIPTDLEVDELLFIIHGSDNSPNLVWPAGYTLLGRQAQGAATQMDIIRHVVDGSEGSTISVTGAGASDERVTWAARITGAYPYASPGVAFANANAANPNPPSLSLIRATPDVLWIVACLTNDGINVLSYPEPDNQWGANNEGAMVGVGGGDLAICSVETFEESSRDPAAFEAVGGHHVAVTIGFTPLPTTLLPITGVGV